MPGNSIEFSSVRRGELESESEAEFIEQRLRDAWAPRRFSPSRIRSLSIDALSQLHLAQSDKVMAGLFEKSIGLRTTGPPRQQPQRQ